jgi:hypothetical protein
MFAYLMFIAGTIFFVGGILETVTTTSSPDWFLFLPYSFSTGLDGMLGLALTSCGIALLIYGIAMGFFYAHDRAWYMKELHKEHCFETKAMSTKKRRKRNGIQTLPA